MNLNLFMSDAHRITCSVINVDYIKSLNNTKTREREYVQARQITMTSCYDILKIIHISTSKIAGFFNKDHATAIHSFKAVKNLRETDVNYRSEYEEIYNKIYYLYLKKYKRKDKYILKTRSEYIIDLKKNIYKKMLINDSINANYLLNQII